MQVHAINQIKCLVFVFKIMAIINDCPWQLTNLYMTSPQLSYVPLWNMPKVS